MINDLVAKAKKASEEYMKLNQEQVDKIVKAMAMAGLEHHMELAKMAVEETGRGIYEDKITKNMFATEYVYHSIKHEKTVGIIKEELMSILTSFFVSVIMVNRVTSEPVPAVVGIATSGGMGFFTFSAPM